MFGMLLAIVALIAFPLTYLMERRLKTKGALFTGPATSGMRVLALVLGLLFAGLFVLELTSSETIHIWFPILAVALLSYGLGAGRLLGRVQGGTSRNSAKQITAGNRESGADNVQVILTSLRCIQEEGGSGNFVVFLADEERNYFVQFSGSRGESALRAEAVSNQFLLPRFALTEKQITLLLSIGWNPPSNDFNGSPNFYRDYEASNDSQRLIIARDALRTLTEVYGLGPQQAVVVKLGLSETLKEKHTTEMDDELRPEYELRDLLKGGVRGKYVSRYRAGTNLVLLDPDVAKAFPDEAAVNEALRLVIQLAEIQRGEKRSAAKV